MASTPPPPWLPDHYERLAKIIETSHDKAISYSKVILGLGYAALFAVWAGTKNDLTQFQRILSALLAVTSLVSYIIYEISQMIAAGSRAYKFPQLLTQHSNNMAAALKEWGEIELRAARHGRIVWIIKLYLTIPTGLGSCGLFSRGCCIADRADESGDLSAD
jgi:hypothetical protein